MCNQLVCMVFTIFIPTCRLYRASLAWVRHMKLPVSPFIALNPSFPHIFSVIIMASKKKNWHTFRFSASPWLPFICLPPQDFPFLDTLSFSSCSLVNWNTSASVSALPQCLGLSLAPSPSMYCDRLLTRARPRSLWLRWCASWLVLWRTQKTDVISFEARIASPKNEWIPAALSQPICCSGRRKGIINFSLHIMHRWRPFMSHVTFILGMFIFDNRWFIHTSLSFNW